MTRLLWVLAGLFPRRFREQFGTDMAEQIRVEGEQARRRGRSALLWFTLATAMDLVRSAVAERWQPTWVHAPNVSGGNGTRWLMYGWTKDLRHSMRGLRRTPGFTALTVGTLGLAMGATAGIFSVVDSVLLDPLPYANAGRLVNLSGSAPGSDLPDEFGLAPEFYLHYRERSRLLEDVAIYNSFTSTLRTDDRVERVRMSVPTVSLFSTLGATPILGRLPTLEDEGRVAVISHALWTTWFGSDPSVIGRSYQIAGTSRMVVGVMGPEFRFPRADVSLWMPYVPEENVVPGRFGREVEALVARVVPGVTREDVVAELTALGRELPERFGGTADYARVMERYRAVVRPLHDHLVGDLSRPLWVLLGSVAIVFLIACANVANLFLVRAERRQRDLAVRRAIGAARGHLFRSQMAESLVVALFAGALALSLAWISVPLVLRAAPPEIPRLGDVRVTGSTLLFTAGIALVSALLCGLVPALRSSSVSLNRLRDGSRGSTRRRGWTRDALVVAQTALALVLLVGSGLLIRSFQRLQRVDPGYDPRDVFTFQIAPEARHLTDGPSWARFHLEFMDRLAALPGVESVGIVENVPLNEGLASDRFSTADAAPGPDGGTLLDFTWAAGDYFRTMRIDVLAGRPFTTADHTTAPGNVVVGRSAAERLWPGADPIGRRLRRGNSEDWHTVVGVVEDVMQYGFRGDRQAVVYFPLVGPTPRSWAITTPAYVLRTERARVIAPEVRALVREVAPEAPMYRVFTMEGLAADSMVQLRFTLLILGITSALALLLGTVGLYSVLSYVVAGRTREIGVRLALGAEAKRVRRMVVAQGTRVVVLGVAIGLAVAMATTRTLGGLLFEVPALDPVTFTTMTAVMLLVGLLASYLPARRASSVDPIESLRID